MPTFTGQSLGPSRILVRDLLKAEWDQRYNRDASFIKNIAAVTTVAGAVQVGHPTKVTNATTRQVLAATDEASCTALFLGYDAGAIPESLAQNAVTALKYPVLVKGPALVNKDIIPANDLAGAAYTLATLVTALRAISPPIEILTLPTQTSTQST